MLAYRVAVLFFLLISILATPVPVLNLSGLAPAQYRPQMQANAGHAPPGLHMASTSAGASSTTHHSHQVNDPHAEEPLPQYDPATLPPYVDNRTRTQKLKTAVAVHWENLRNIVVGNRH
ncbi:hypothetical protein FRC17_003068 [Serendipita sp. 399]|nr:hypothetical protein FRC17_003068 [Serendipita sp. 399]